ncbi:SEPT7 protein, partial [Polyodon spathula]|nr:SEPT7 protein [Polyodon spathula]
MSSSVQSGESGLGKSTLINSLFLTDLYSPEYPGPSHRIKKTVQVEQSKVFIKEGGVQLLLTIVDTPGFGDAVDNSNCWQPVIDHIDSKFEDYLNAESRVNRRQMPDNRVHCCLYFIAPSGHGLKPLDIEFMKRLHEKVNIIPLIAKADTLTPEECQQFKKQIMKEIQEHKIRMYEFPEMDDEEENKLIKKITDRLPLAVVGSNTVIEVVGKRVRGRQYPWGVAEVENSEHCDFTILRNMLIRTHMQDLKDVTNNVHYENYRSRKLAAVTYNGVDNNRNKGQLTKYDTVEGISPLAQMEEERQEHVAKMNKMEMEMEQVFDMKVKEKIQKLKDSEAELQRRHEQMKKNLEAQHKELEEKRRQYEDEKMNWEAQQRILEQQKLDSSRGVSSLSMTSTVHHSQIVTSSGYTDATGRSPAVSSLRCYGRNTLHPCQVHGRRAAGKPTSKYSKSRVGAPPMRNVGTSRPTDSSQEWRMKHCRRAIGMPTSAFSRSCVGALPAGKNSGWSASH